MLIDVLPSVEGFQLGLDGNVREVVGASLAVPLECADFLSHNDLNLEDLHYLDDLEGHPFVVGLAEELLDLPRLGGHLKLDFFYPLHSVL